MTSNQNTNQKPKRDESLYGGKYHGPSLEPGPTWREYQQLRAEEYDQRLWERDQW